MKIKRKPTVTFLFLFWGISLLAQTPISEYFFTNGSLSDVRNPNNTLAQTGTMKTNVIDRDGFADNAISLNGDVLQAVSATKQGNYSVSFWMKTTTNDANQRIILDQFGGSGDIGYKLYLENGNLVAKARFYYYNDAPRISSYATLTKAAIADGNWHHVVLTFSTWYRSTLNGQYPNVTYRLYIDNVLETSQNIEILTTKYGSDDFRTIHAIPISIGNTQDQSGDPYSDAIDDVRLYAFKLSDAEVGNIYSQRTSPTIIYVNKNATGANDGSSWANAFTELVSATDLAVAPGDQIWVAAGTYKPDASDRLKSFVLNDGVSLYGGFSGNETQLTDRDWRSNQTILSGDLNGDDNGVITYTNALRSDNSYRVVHVTGSDVTIDGITITSGHANNTGNSSYNRGGAIYKETATTSLILKNLIVQNTVSNVLNISALFSNTSTENTLHVENCIFHNNFARYGVGFTAEAQDGTTVRLGIYNSLFYENTAGDVSAGDGFGGSSFTAFARNGTLYLDAINNTFVNNKDHGTASGQDKATVLLRRLNNDGANVLEANFHNNIFYNNEQSVGVINTQAIGLMNRPTNLLNSLLFTHNISAHSNIDQKATTSMVSDILDQNPLFTDASLNDFTLQPTSPAIGAGDNSKIPAGILGDLAGNIRIYNGVVDMGAYEQGSTPVNLVPPVAVAQDITVHLDANGQATITAADINNGSNDDDTPEANLVLSLDKAAFTCADLGDNTVTLTVTDASGNQSTATATVTVADNVAPTVATQNITVSLDANGNATVDASSLDNGSTDNCTDSSALVFSLSKSTFTCVDLGSNTVTLTVTDAFGNEGTATATVTVADNAAPTVATQNITVSLDANGNATVDASSLDNGSTDNCTDASALVFSLSKSTFTCADLGENAVTLTVTDASGNEGTATATVTVEDNAAPTVATQNITVSLDANGNATVDASSLDNGSTDICTDASALVFSLSKSTFTCADLGDNTVNLIVTDASGNQGTAIATVTVVDNIAPTVAAQNIVAELQSNGTVTVDASTVNDGSSDNCSSTLTFTLDKSSFTCADLGENAVTLTVTDASGNQSTATSTITVVDRISPSLLFAGGVTLALDATGSATLDPSSLVSSTTDNCTNGNDIRISSSKSNFSCGDLGLNDVDITVEDAAGNQTTATYQLRVEDNMAPVVRTKNITLQLINGAASLLPEDIDDGSSDNCTAAANLNFSLDMTSFTTSHIGENTVTLSVTDASGNVATGTAIVTVTEKQSQTISFSVPSEKTYGDAPFDLSATATSGLAVSFSLISGPAILSGSTLSITGAGTIVVEASQVGNSDFLPAPDVQKTIQVAAAQLFVIADDKAITYGDALPALTYSYSGFVNGDDATVLTTQPSISTDALGDGQSDAGTYTITVSGAEAVNYEISYESGTLTINKASQTITVEPVADKLTTDEPFNIVASVDTGLPLTYTITGPATINEGTVTLDGTEGTVTITVAQAGTVNYTAASQDVSFEVRRPLAVSVASQVEIYPNPALNWLHIDAPEMVEVSIVTLEGRVVLKQSIQKGQLDVSHLSEGMYLLTLATDEGIVSKKIVKK